MSKNMEKVSKRSQVMAFVATSLIFSGFIFMMIVGRESAEDMKKESKITYAYEVTDRNGSSDGFTKKDGKELLNLVRKNVDELASFPVMVKGDKIGSLSSGKKLHGGIYEIQNRGDFYVVEDHVVFNSTDIRDHSNYFSIIKGKDAERVKTLLGVTN